VLGNVWRRFVMRRGAVLEEIEASLPPHVGLAEDNCS
jgi:hypothetical protein